MSRGELTKEDYEILRAPFDVHAVRFRLGSWLPGSRMSVLTYIDARLVMERLSEVDPNWTAKYNQPVFAWDDNNVEWLRHHAPLECTIDLKGAKRSDVGQLPVTAAKPDQELYPFKEKKNYDTGEITYESPRWEISDKHFKALYSDALKRAAVHFGVGAYLYSLKGFEVAKGEYDKGFLKPAGTQKMKDRYQQIVTHPMFEKRFGYVRTYGDEAVEAIDKEIAVL